MLIATVRRGPPGKGAIPSARLGPDVDVGVIGVAVCLPLSLSDTGLKNVLDFMGLGRQRGQCGTVVAVLQSMMLMICQKRDMAVELLLTRMVPAHAAVPLLRGLHLGNQKRQL